MCLKDLRSSMLGSLFGSVCSIDITFDAEQNRKTAALGKDKKGERAYIFTDGEVRLLKWPLDGSLHPFG